MYQNIKIGTLEQAVKYVQSLLLKLWTYLILYSTVSIVNFLQPIAGWKNKPKLDNNKNRELSKTCSKYHQQLKQTKKKSAIIVIIQKLEPLRFIYCSGTDNANLSHAFSQKKIVISELVNEDRSRCSKVNWK